MRILNAFMEREHCVCEIMQALEVSQARASCNLKGAAASCQRISLIKALVRQRRAKQ